MNVIGIRNALETVATPHPCLAPISPQRATVVCDRAMYNNCVESGAPHATALNQWVQRCIRWTVSRAGWVLAGIGVSSCAWIEPLLDQSLMQTDDPVDVMIVAFNVESGGANPTHVAEQYIAPLDGVDIWGFSEVQNAEWLRLLEKGAEAGEDADFRSILGTSGGGDRLAIVYNSAQLRAMHTEELEALSFGGRVRASLITHFHVRGNGQEFLLMVNHLYRSENERRHEQAQMLNTWAQTQTLPMIAMGDYNFDFDVGQGDQGTRDRGFDLMLQNDAFQWVRPQTLVPTHCNSTYNTILDFIFVGNGAVNWPVKESAILYTDPNSGYCPDTSIKSDHRPVMAILEIPAPL